MKGWRRKPLTQPASGKTGKTTSRRIAEAKRENPKNRVAHYWGSSSWLTPPPPAPRPRGCGDGRPRGLARLRVACL